MKDHHLINEFSIVGISIRTTNKNGQSSQDIEGLWKRFWEENIQDQIPNKLNDTIYAVYTDYESDYTAAYTTIIGLPVATLENIPNEFVGLKIKTANYKKLVSKGKMPEAIVKTWFDIWANTKLNNLRSYSTDFTVHDKKYFLGKSAEVTTYIAIK